MDDYGYINDDMIRFMERRAAEKDRRAAVRAARERQLAAASAAQQAERMEQKSRARAWAQMGLCGVAAFALLGSLDALADPGTLLMDTTFFVSGSYLLGSFLRLVRACRED